MKPKRFRKKPVIVTAYQLTKKMIIPTLEGDMIGNPGDWVITGVNGEQYPCKPDIFEKTYEPVEDEENTRKHDPYTLNSPETYAGRR